MSQYPAVVELSSLDGTNGFKINGEAAGDQSGISVSSAGDVNGDGFADLIVGAYNADPNGSYSGASYVVFGKASGFGATLELSSLDGSNGFKIDGQAATDKSGYSVSSAGDVNGDGFADVIVGAYGADPNGSYSGASYVVFGKASGFGATLDLSSLDGSNGFKINGQAGDFSGWSVASAGDVNGDGFADLIVGASAADPNGNNSGASYVVFGEASGFGATLDLSSLDGSDGFRINGEAEDDDSGFSVASAGDVNGDGFADLIIGARAADPNGSNSGASYVVFGKASVFGATLELSSLDGTNGFKMNGQAADFAGRSVASAGDVNGDGFADLIVGAYGASPNGNQSGASYVVFGKASGFGAKLGLSSLDGSNGFKINGEAAFNNSGISVSSAGDVNGDGFADVIVGAWQASPNGSVSGASYVVFGKASGFGATLELSSLDGSNGFKVNGEAEFDQSGWSVAAAGDVNGDGFADLITGARRADPNGDYSGASYVVFGSMPGEAVIRTGTAIANTIHGGNFDDTLNGLGGSDTLYGHGGADALDGGTGTDTLDGGAGADTMIGGGGNDIYVVDNAGDTVTESTAHGIDTVQSSISYTLGDNVEKLTLTGSGNIDGTGNSLNNRLIGNSGNNTLDGGSGADTMLGGAGDDIFVVNNAGDTVTESAAEGTDTVQSSIGYTLGADVENLTLTGSANIKGTGNSLNNTLTGNGGNNTLDGSIGGADSLYGSGGNDSFVFGSAFAANDLIDGGTGADTVRLNGDYSAGVVFGATTMVNVETITIAAGHSYNLATADATVASGATLTVNGAALGSSDSLAFNGSAETNGHLRIIGGAGDDILTGGTKFDHFIGGGGADRLTGNAGNDVFIYGGASDSTGVHYDTIVGFNANHDKFDLTFGVTGIDTKVGNGSLSAASFDTDLAIAVGSGRLAADHAVLFTVSAGDLGGHTFLVVDANSTAGYQASADLVFDITGSVSLAHLGTTNFI